MCEKKAPAESQVRHVGMEHDDGPSMMQLPSKIRLVVQEECPSRLQLPSQKGLVEQVDSHGRLNERHKQALSQNDNLWLPEGRKENTNRMEDKYLKGWREWVERDRMEKIQQSEMLEKKGKLSRRWDMIRNVEI